MTSVLENNKDVECNIFVLTAGLKESNVEFLKSVGKKYNQTISIEVMDGKLFKGLPSHGRYRESIFYRFMLPMIVKDSKVLYLDCDIIVRKSLAEMYSTDLSEYACAAIRDQRSDTPIMINKWRMSSPYFNSGVLLMNLDYWRENNIVEKLFEFFSDTPREQIIWPDQDALNVVLENRVMYLPFTFNFQYHLYSPKDKLEVLYTRWPEIDAVKEDPVICHYTHNHKPWHKECPHPHTEWFDYYSKLCPNLNLKKKYCDSIVIRFFDFIHLGLNWASKFFY